MVWKIVVRLTLNLNITIQICNVCNVFVNNCETCFLHCTSRMCALWWLW